MWIKSNLVRLDGEIGRYPSLQIGRKFLSRAKGSACRYWKFPKEELLRKYSHSCKFESQVIQTRVEMFTPVHYKFRQSCQPFFRSRIEQSKPIRLRSFLLPPPKRVGIVLLSLTFKSVVCVC